MKTRCPQCDSDKGWIKFYDKELIKPLDADTAVRYKAFRASKYDLMVACATADHERANELRGR